MTLTPSQGLAIRCAHGRTVYRFPILISAPAQNYNMRHETRARCAPGGPAPGGLRRASPARRRRWTSRGSRRSRPTGACATSRARSPTPSGLRSCSRPPSPRSKPAHYRPFAGPVVVYVCGTSECFDRRVPGAARFTAAVIYDNRVLLAPRLFEREPRSACTPSSSTSFRTCTSGQRLGHYTMRIPVWFHEGLASLVAASGGADLVTEEDARRAIAAGEHFLPDASARRNAPQVRGSLAAQDRDALPPEHDVARRSQGPRARSAFAICSTACKSACASTKLSTRPSAPARSSWRSGFSAPSAALSSSARRPPQLRDRRSVEQGSASPGFRGCDRGGDRAADTCWLIAHRCLRGRVPTGPIPIRRAPATRKDARK